MNFKTAKEYIEYLDEQSGESWSNATEELADVMENYAKMYHERQLKLLGIANVVEQSEQFTPKQLYILAHKYNMADFIKILKEAPTWKG
jgi:hypothetical protein